MMWERHLAAISFPEGLNIRGKMPLPHETRKLSSNLQPGICFYASQLSPGADSEFG